MIAAYKHSQKYRSSNRSWLIDEKRRKKKAFTLEFSKSYDDSVSSTQDDWNKKLNEPDLVPSRPERNGYERKGVNGKTLLEEKGSEVRKKKTHFAEKAKSIQTSPREAVDIEKAIKEKEIDAKRPLERERHVKRKLKAKSPTTAKVMDGNHTYRPQQFERREIMGPNLKLHLNIPTSDDSSEQYRKEG